MGKSWSSNSLAINWKVIGHALFSMPLSGFECGFGIYLLLLVVTLVIGLISNSEVTQFILTVLVCCSFHKSLQIPKTLLSIRTPECLMSFHGPPRIEPLHWADSSTYIYHAAFSSATHKFNFGIQDIFGVNGYYCQR